MYARLTHWLSLSTLSVTLAACSFGLSSKGCSDVGFMSGVGVSAPPSIAIVDFCIDDVCNSSRNDVMPNNTIAVPDEPAEYAYRLVVARDGGEPETLVGTVTTKEYRGNGPGCDPLTANAILAVSESGEIEISYP